MSTAVSNVSGIKDAGAAGRPDNGRIPFPTPPVVESSLLTTLPILAAVLILLNTRPVVRIPLK